MSDPNERGVNATATAETEDPFLVALGRGVDQGQDPLVALCAALPAFDLPASDVQRMRARLHAEFEAAHASSETSGSIAGTEAGVAHLDLVGSSGRALSIGRAGRLAEATIVTLVCVVQIVWLLSMLQHH
ncbi:MAG: hypothetical protein KC766_22505 [Myxococcales bacterium]|nr:hypothetical protein [Myxococcales bacterium]